MEKQKLTEKEFLKTHFDDIINVSKLFEGIIEYAIADKYASDTVTLYRFRNDKNIGTFELDKDELENPLIDKPTIKAVNFVSTVAYIILYSLIFANIDVIATMNPELVLPLVMLNMFPMIKSLRYTITGFTSIEKAIEVNIIEAIGLIPIVILLSIISFNKQNYLMIALYPILAIIISMRYMLNIIKCTNNNDL